MRRLGCCDRNWFRARGGADVEAGRGRDFADGVVVEDVAVDGDDFSRGCAGGADGGDWPREPESSRFGVLPDWWITSPASCCLRCRPPEECLQQADDSMWRVQWLLREIPTLRRRLFGPAAVSSCSRWSRRPAFPWGPVSRSRSPPYFVNSSIRVSLLLISW